MRRAWTVVPAVVGLLVTGVVVPPAPVAATRGMPLTLVEQTFTVAPTGSLSLTIRLPDMDLPTLAAADVVVTAYRRVTTRDAVRRAIGGELPPALDAVDTPVSATAPGADGTVTLTMPIETNRLTPEGLQLANPGLYPIVVDVRSTGDPIAETVTFVHRLPVSPPSTYDTLPVALAMDVTAPVSLTDSGAVAVDDTVGRQLAALADTLATSAMPATVRIPAGLLADFAESDAGAADRLRRSLSGNTLLSSTTLPLDPSAAAASGLNDLYRQWLRDGEDVLYRETGVRASRRLAFLDHDTSLGGGALIRDAGVQALIVSPSIATELASSAGAQLEPGQLFEVDVGGEARLDAVAVDRQLAQMLATASASPALTAVYAVAELLAARLEVLDGGGSPGRHGIVLGLPDLGIPASAVVSELSALIGATAELRATTVDQVLATTDYQRDRGDLVTVRLPESAGVDLSDRTATTTGLLQAIDQVSSMLPVDDTRPQQWSAIVGLLPSTGLSAAQVGVLAQKVGAELDALRSAVRLPAPFKFSLTGRTSTIRFNVENTSSTALTVRLRMSSPKLTFPQGEQLVTLAPNAATQIAVPVEARTSGEYGVSLDALAPRGDAPLAPTVALTASLTTLTGLGNFITGAALLILLTWWVHHWRTARRRKAAVAAIDRHPAVGGVPELSPDAATSTLPPS